MELRICHLYPEHLNLYGDRGNVIALVKRCLWRGIDLSLTDIRLRESPRFTEFDLIFMGGGQDREQWLVYQDLVELKKAALIEAAESGIVLLAICGGYQLLGHYYKGVAQAVDGLGMLDLWTEAGPRRMVGDIAVKVSLPGLETVLVGYENHAGRTHLGPGTKSLGRVLAGHGNNGRDGTEGAIYKNVFGTYLHGSLLPKNPVFVDHLLRLALERKYGEGVYLPPLPDLLEEKAHQAMLRRLKAGE